MDNVEIMNSPLNISRQIREIGEDRQKAIEFIEKYKDYAKMNIPIGDFSETSAYSYRLANHLAIVIRLLKKKHKVD